MANASPNDGAPDEIDFNIDPPGPHTILLDSVLPPIADPVIIDGTSQPGWSNAPIIEIDGSGLAAGTDGLLIGLPAAGSTVQGLAINAFPRDGIVVAADNVIIDASYVGVGLDGTTDRGNGRMGVMVAGGSGTQIGANGASGTGNVISGNGQHGINVQGGTDIDPVVGTVIGANFIGTDASGTAALGNTVSGIVLNANARNSLVGGLIAAARNVISGNTFGIGIFNGADSNTIQGNYIGTDVTGTSDLGNSGAGIELLDVAGTLIGGGSGATNIISGNGTAILGAPGIRIRGSEAVSTLVRGNLIGVSATGLPLGNSTYGIQITDQATQNPIGSTGPGLANTIAYNGDDGILVENDATGNSFRGNSIHDNGGLGIDLAPDGVTENDLDDPDSGANDLTNFPVITAAVSDGSDATVDGFINSIPDSTQTLDFYVSSSCDPTGNGEGASWEGFQVVIVESSGGPNAPFSQTLNGVAPGAIRHRDRIGRGEQQHVRVQRLLPRDRAGGGNLHRQLDHRHR